MTFSIVGRCARTGELGVAVSSSSIAVGARCAWVRAGVGAVATQNVTLPSLGTDVLELIAGQELDSARALERALSGNVASEYRQLGVVDHRGRAAVFTGAQALGTSDAQTGEQCAVQGNMLASREVIAAMVAAFEESEGPLATRLLRAMRSGLSAGGEVGPVHSAALKVSGEVPWPTIDLRVDWTEGDPIAELEALWRSYAPQEKDYLTRALDPTAAPKYGVPGDE